MKVLITGGGGFLARGMVQPFEKHDYQLRLMGRRPFETPHELFQGSVTDLELAREAVKGMDAIIINHMAPRDPDAYATPEVSYDINVTGAANVFFAAAEAGIKKIVLISSTGLGPQGDVNKWINTVPVPSTGIYATTKALQETIAQCYHREFGMQIALLRVGYIVDAEEMADKYGRVISERNALDTDRRDIGEVARLFLERDDLGLEVFPVMSTKEAYQEWGTEHTAKVLGWTPRFDFDVLPLPEA